MIARRSTQKVVLRHFSARSTHQKAWHHQMQMATTDILPVDDNIITISGSKGVKPWYDDWHLELKPSVDATYLERAASELRQSNVPVSFPTETVYGLGADATRSDAVRGIYMAKQRPADNPLIVHVHSLRQLRCLLKPDDTAPQGLDEATHRPSQHTTMSDVIPAVYLPVIEKFWPGPLTVILPNPSNSVLASEVTAGLPTFGARMPSNKLALALIKLADRPIAAPSANSSGKPSPTTSEHVRVDLNGRINTIVDGGLCAVGVESTVVNGLVNPPLILRPGGVGLRELRLCPGWENVQIGYQDFAHVEDRPLAPGMKYRHYSPKASVVLFEADVTQPSANELFSSGCTKIGIIRTRTWISFRDVAVGGKSSPVAEDTFVEGQVGSRTNGAHAHLERLPTPIAVQYLLYDNTSSRSVTICEISLGPTTEDMARGIFAAFRSLDFLDVEKIFVEGVSDSMDDIAPAVMNRLRKAAEVRC